MTLEDAELESAYGTDITSATGISGQTLRKETFSIQEEPTKSKEKWGRCRTYGQMIGMGVIGFILILLLINSYRIHFKVEENTRTITNLKIKFDELPKLESKTNSEYRKVESLEKENEKVMEHLSKTLKEVMPIMINEEVRNQEIKRDENPYKDSVYRINSASYMFGASVDTSYSFSSDLSGESDLVLLDRPNPPANRAWCSDENEPVLTVNLANYIKPTAVSYQHFKWNRTVPHGSPRIFDVFTCIDSNCEKTEPLVTNCEYKSFGEIQEQIYPLHKIYSNTKSIGKVQFRFLKNHGNVKKTCVSLVRVYGETTDLPKMREYKESVGYRGNRSPAGKTCSKLGEMFHNSPFSYDKFELKTCEYLFSKGCCSVCPECCDECYIDNYTSFYTAIFTLLFFCGFALYVSVCTFGAVHYVRYKKRRNGEQSGTQNGRQTSRFI